MMNEAALKYIIARLVDNAKDAASESDQSPDDMYLQGRREAYYEMLDILKSELDAHDAKLDEFGLMLDADSLI